MIAREYIAFKTLDGLTLRGYLHLADQTGPAIIMTPGFNSISIALDEIAEYLCQAGFTVLVYDARSVGASDGLPRNEINPTRNVEDYHDALTFLKHHERVDENQIAYWGYSYSGAIALCAAALDRRAKAVLAIAPMTIWNSRIQENILEDAMNDRESRLQGSAPAMVPMLTEENMNPAGIGITSDGTVTRASLQKAASLFPEFVPQTTVSTYHHITAFDPLKLIRCVSPTPVLLIIPELDTVSPAHLQKSLIFDSIKGPKKLMSMPSQGHMDILKGKRKQEVFGGQVDFLCNILTHKVGPSGNIKSRLPHL